MKKVLAILLALAMVFSFAACGKKEEAKEQTQNEPEKVEPIIIKFASADTTAQWNAAEDYSQCAVDKFFRDELEKRTNGRYKLEVYADGQLAGGTAEQIQGIQLGDFGYVQSSTANLGSYTDAFAELNVPFLFKNEDVAYYVLDSEIGDAMKAKCDSDIQGVKLCFIKDIGFRQATSSKGVIKSAADFKGLKMRVQSNPIQMAAFEALGCSVTNVTLTELFSSLQQHLVDAEENPWSTIYGQKLYEVQKYASATNHIYTATCMFMEQAVYDALSAEDKAIFDQLFKDCVEYNRQIVAKGQDYYKGLLKDGGMEIYEPTAAELSTMSEKMVNDVYPKCKEAMGEARWNALLDKVAEAEKALGL